MKLWNSNQKCKGMHTGHSMARYSVEQRAAFARLRESAKVVKIDSTFPRFDGENLAGGALYTESRR